MKKEKPPVGPPPPGDPRLPRFRCEVPGNRALDRVTVSSLPYAPPLTPPEDGSPAP